jgi:hypothetical protein
MKISQGFRRCGDLGRLIFGLGPADTRKYTNVRLN